MIVDVEFQVISTYGWIELIGDCLKVRNNGIQVPEQSKTARMHILDDGIHVLLPPKVVEHLRRSIEHEFTHAPGGAVLEEPVAKPIRIVVRAS